jgi:carbamoyl-phosphate synthase large subunit
MIYSEIMKRIMITAAGGPAGFCLAKYLKGKSYLIGLDGSADSPAKFFCNEVHLVPSASSYNYEDEMLKVIRETKPDIIIPTFDEDLLFFDGVRGEIDCFVLLSPGETLHVCNDKRRTAELFSGFAAKTFLSEQIREQRNFPLFIKPAIGRGSKIGFKVENVDDFEYALGKVKDPFIQEWLPGPEVTVDTFADLEGKLLGVAPRIREQTRGGISTKGRFIRDEQLEKFCSVIHERLKIAGPANIQFMKDTSGAWRLIEINPRYSGGLGLSYKAGFDSISPLLTIDPVKRTLKVEKMTPNYNICVVRYWEERVMDG